MSTGKLKQAVSENGAIVLAKVWLPVKGAEQAGSHPACAWVGQEKPQQMLLLA